MSYFLLDAQGRRIGPYTREELELFLARGLIGATASVVDESDCPAVPLSDALALATDSPRRASVSVPALVPTPEPRAASSPVRKSAGAPAGSADPASAGQDLLRLAPHLMLPLEDLARLRWLDNQRIAALALVGLLPLFLLFYLQSTGDLGGAIWGIALYSSLLWALFFYVTFAQPEVRIFRCATTFLGSAIFSIGLVALARYIIPFEWVSLWIQAPGLGTRWAGHWVGVALVEELAKLFMLYFIWALRPRPQVMMFYGLMAGLGFGIYEGVTYQTSQNLRISFPQGEATPDGAAIYHILNILRLTSLPFLHAMWTGIAGYFVGFASQYPERRGGLLLAALLVPSLLHATYNTFSGSLVGLTVAVLTVVALNLYLAKGRDFERLLTENPAA